MPPYALFILILCLALLPCLTATSAARRLEVALCAGAMIAPMLVMSRPVAWSAACLLCSMAVMALYRQSSSEHSTNPSSRTSTIFHAISSLAMAALIMLSASRPERGGMAMGNMMMSGLTMVASTTPRPALSWSGILQPGTIRALAGAFILALAVGCTLNVMRTRPPRTEKLIAEFAAGTAVFIAMLNVT